MEDQVEEFPELATNEDWRGIMVRARKAHSFSQDVLAAKIVAIAPSLTATQALISRIETGDIGSSKLIKPICRVLNIPLPEHFVSEEEKEWARIGRVLRHRDPTQARAVLAMLEGMAKQYEADQPDDQQNPEIAPESKPKR